MLPPLFFRSLLALSVTTAVLTSARGLAQEPSGLAAAVAIEKVVVDAIARSEKSVVAIGVFLDDRINEGGFGIDQLPDLDAVPDSFATGVVIDRRGLILTTKHVLKEGTQKARRYIRVAGKPVWVPVQRVLGSDPFSDLAVLELDNAVAGTLNLRPIEFGNADLLKKGQIAIALGNPYAIARDGEVSASWGIISNLRRKAPPFPDKQPPESRPTVHHYGTLIQTDAKLNLGTSGGPLLNLRGEMVGLTTSISALVGYEKSAGYALAVDDLFRRVVDTLKEGREVEYGFLGVSPRDLSHVERIRGRRGVRIDRVVPGTPASGVLLAGDVVTQINEYELKSTADLMLAVGQQPAGSRVTMKVDRFDRLLTVPVVLTKNRVIGQKTITTPSPAWRGLRVEYPAALRSLTIPEPIPDNCVIAIDVAESSPAAKAGVDEGAQITHVENVPVATPPEFATAVAGRRGPVKLVVVNADGFSTVTVSDE